MSNGDLKRCSMCGVEKALGDFSKSNGRRIASCKECNRARHRAWVAANPGKMKAARAAHRAKQLASAGHPDPTKRERRARYNRRHPERVAAAQRASQRARSVGHDPDGILYLEALDDDPCSYCGGPASVADHIVPKAEGGPDRWDNLTSACKSCNSGKRDTPLLMYLLRARPPVAKPESLESVR